MGAPPPPNMQNKSENRRQFVVPGDQLQPSSGTMLQLQLGFEGGGQEETEQGDTRDL